VKNKGWEIFLSPIFLSEFKALQSPAFVGSEFLALPAVFERQKDVGQKDAEKFKVLVGL
jgi:hypothetical protein